MFIKVCRDCGEEYRPDILCCADCGGELEARVEGENAGGFAPRREEPPPPEVDLRPPGEYLPIAWSANAGELTPLADRLVEAGIPFYMRPRAATKGEGPSGYEIRVRHEEWGRVLEEMASLAAEPDSLRPSGGGGAGVGDAAPTSLGEAAADTSGPEPGRERCPACATELASHVVECPECGLAVGGSASEPAGD